MVGCPCCDLEFSTFDDLYMHRLWRHEECKICRGFVVNRAELEEHMKNDHSDASDTEEEDDDDESDDDYYHDPEYAPDNKT